MATKAIYRRYNGTSWDDIAFATFADIVKVLSDDSWAKVGVKSESNVNALLLQAYSWGKAYSDAMSSSTGNIITTGNITGNATEAISKATKIYSVSAVNQKFTDLLYSDANSDSSRYVSKVTQTGGKIEATHTAFDTSMSDSSVGPVQNKVVKAYVDQAKADAIAVANGKTQTYVIETSSSLNSWFNVKKTTSVTKVRVATSATSFTTIDGSSVNFNSLKIGDTVLTATENIADFFYAGQDDQSDNAYVFYRIEADTPDITLYVKKSEASVTVDSSHAAEKGFVYEVTQSDGKVERKFESWASSLTDLGTIPAGASVVKKYVDDKVASVHAIFYQSQSSTPSGMKEGDIWIAI